MDPTHSKQPTNNPFANTNTTLIEQAKIIEKRLLDMSVGETISLGKDLRDSSGKNEAVISFKKIRANEYEVRNGNFSLNSTEAIISGNTVEVTLPVFLKPGDVIRMTVHEETISENPTTQNPSALSVAITNLVPGQKLVIGRINFPDLGGKISRRHCTLTRLDDIKNNGGKTTKIYELSDGARTSYEISVLSEGGYWHNLDYNQTLISGNKIKLFIDNNEILITIPSPHSFDFTNFLCADQDLDSLNFTDIQHSLFARAPSDAEYITGNKIHAEALGAYIKDGLELIRNGDYAKARMHFTQVKALERCGFKLEENRVLYSEAEEITGKIAYDLLSEVAFNSWFMHEQNLVYPSFGELTKKDGQPTEEEQKIINDFNREVVLIYAEEWVHAYQALLNGCISKKAELYSALPRTSQGNPLFNFEEIDVAQFFKEQNVPLSQAFLERYERDKAILLLKHYSSDAEKKLFRDSLILADLNKRIFIGLDTSLDNTCFGRNEGHNYISIAKRADIPEELQPLRAKHIEEQIKENPLIITPLGSGKYEVRPLFGHTFRRDNYGIWRVMQKVQELSSGTTLRLGPSFEFTLP